MILIRPIERDDLPRLIELAHEMKSEIKGYGNHEIDEKKLVELGESIIASPDEYCGFAAFYDDKLVGFFAGAITEVFFGRSLTAYDITFYVAKPYRKSINGSFVASMLLAQFEAWAMRKGAKDMLLGITTEVDTEHTERFYNRRGFRTCGVFVKKEIGG